MKKLRRSELIIMKRKMVLAFTILLTFSMILSACTLPATQNTTAPVAEGTTAAPTTAKPTEPEKPAKLRLFYVTQGNSIKEDFDFADNQILNVITKAANVEITEVIVPPWSDTKTKYNLMMSSGNLSDIIHFNGVNTLINDGENGAFHDLTDFVKNNKTVNERYAPYFKQLQADDGKIYALRTLPVDGDLNSSMFVRWDVLQDLGYTALPTTLDGWLDAMRALKAKYPDSVPYTTMDNFHFCEFIFNCFGISGRGIGWQQNFGKVIHAFEHPLYKDALKVYKTMLEEGLMDKEFITSKRADFDEKRYNKKALVNQQNLGMAMVFFPNYIDKGILEARSIPAEWPLVDDPRVDPNAVYEGKLAVGNTGLSIASTTKELEGAKRFVEQLLTKETELLCTWGIEGIDYNVVNGEKIEVIDDKSGTQGLSGSSRSLYRFLFGNNTRVNIAKSFQAGINKLRANVPGITEKEIEDYTKLCWSQYDKILDINAKQPSKAAFTYFIILEPDTKSRAAEANAEATAIAAKAMRGDISFEEFDAQAATFLKKYQFITDEYNQKMPAAQAKVD